MSYLALLSTLSDDDTDDEQEQTEPVDDTDPTLITLLVGPEERPLKISESSLRKVTFFQKALDSGMRESQERTIHLEEEDYKTVQGLVRWLERGAPMEAPDLQRVDFRIDLWVLGEWLMCPELQNAVMHSITIEGPPMHESHYQPEAIAQVYRRTMEDSAMRRVLIDLFVKPRVLNMRMRKWMPIISTGCNPQVVDDIEDRVEEFKKAWNGMDYYSRRHFGVRYAVDRVLLDTSYMVPVMVNGSWVTPHHPVAPRVNRPLAFSSFGCEVSDRMWFQMFGPDCF